MDVCSLHRLNNRLKSQVEVITVMWVEEQTAIYWSSQQCGLWAERNNSHTQIWNYFLLPN